MAFGDFGQSTPYSDVINQLHTQSRLDPVRGGAESPLVNMFRRLRSLTPQAPMHPKMIALHAVLRPRSGSKLGVKTPFGRRGF